MRRKSLRFHACGERESGCDEACRPARARHDFRRSPRDDVVYYARSSLLRSAAIPVPTPRLRTLFDCNGLRARLAWYAPGQAMARHAHERHQVSLLLGGTLAETAAGGEFRTAGPAIGVKGAGMAHADDYGPAGALIFGIDVDIALALPGVSAAWQWRASPARLLANGRALLRALCAGTLVEPESRLWEWIADLGDAEPARAGEPPRWVARALARLQEESTPLAELARDEGVHPVYFSRAVARWTGASPSTLRARARMQRALDALCRGRPLVDAALHAGFCDQAHFSRAARAQVGLSPRQLRALLG